MNVEKYFSQNQQAIAQECQAITDKGNKAIITAKDQGKTYVYKVSTVEEFTNTIPDNQFFKAMREGIRNAVLNKVVPIVVFEGQEAKIISLPDYFQPEDSKTKQQ